jgi:hypothetical protein
MIIPSAGRDERRNQHVLKNRALRQQIVILKDKADHSGCGTSPELGLGRACMDSADRG